jgi:hypothetical protein
MLYVLYFYYNLVKMAHIPVQAKTLQILNDKIIKKTDLPSNYSTLADKWVTSDKNLLLKTAFSSFWVITLTSSKHNMYCGSDVIWERSYFAPPKKNPDLILVIENNMFKGIIMGDTINELISLGDWGIYVWISSIPPPSDPLEMLHAKIAALAGGAPLQQPTPLAHVRVEVAPPPLMQLAPPRTLLEFMHQSQPPPPPAYIRVGNQLFAVPHGTTSIQVVPNQTTIPNISHYKRR